jgi:hypothetical protein
VKLKRHALRKNGGGIVHIARETSTKRDGNMAELRKATSSWTELLTVGYVKSTFSKGK